MPRVSEFNYGGKRRIVIERGPDSRGCGLLCTQIVPEKGIRTFKPDKMIDVKKVGRLRSWYYLLKSIRVG
jgi:hypothetical protein